MSIIKSITVYLGSSGHARPVFQQAAETLGHVIGEHGQKLVYGGMDAGLMGLLAKHALETGAHVTGIVPRKLKDSERILGNLSETIMVEDLWERKKLMFDRADAIVSLPGGFGTLDETLEMLYWGSLRLHDIPLVLVNIEGYWDSVITYLHSLPDFDARFMIVVEKVEDIFPALASWERPDIEIEKGSFPHFEDEIARTTEDPIMIDKASIENSYYAVCALGLKQLGKHARPIGFLNTNGQFDALLEWFKTAQRESFITEKCLKLYAAHENADMLREILKHQNAVTIDLHKEKWGAPS